MKLLITEMKMEDQTEILGGFWGLYPPTLELEPWIDGAMNKAAL